MSIGSSSVSSNTTHIHAHTHTDTHDTRTHTHIHVHTHAHTSYIHTSVMYVTGAVELGSRPSQGTYLGRWMEVLVLLLSAHPSDNILPGRERFRALVGSLSLGP